MLDGTIPVEQAVGVQAQVFTIVNDEAYYYPDLINGMIVDGPLVGSVGSYGTDIATYTGSTTGTSRDNNICSRFAPITWQVGCVSVASRHAAIQHTQPSPHCTKPPPPTLPQVDRQCHLISASSFDKMCADMRSQRDDMCAHPRHLVLTLALTP